MFRRVCFVRGVFIRGGVSFCYSVARGASGKAVNEVVAQGTEATRVMRMFYYDWGSIDVRRRRPRSRRDILCIAIQV